MTDNELIWHWQERLRLQDWNIATSVTPCDDADERSSVDMDLNVKRAVIRFDPTLPTSQRERQVLHEMLHIRIAGLRDVFTEKETTEAEKTWWSREAESSIEALVDAFLPDQPREEYRGAAAWVTAIW